MLRLNLGCGRDIRSGYINIDNRRLPGVDRVCDVFNLNSYAAGSVDEIFAKDILEHCSRRNVRSVLGSWIALLKPGGIITVICPNLRLLADRWVRGELRTEQYVRQVYGEQDHDGNTHRNGFDKELLTQYLRGAGVRSIEVLDERHDNNNLIVRGRK